MADDRGPDIESAKVAKHMAVLRLHLIDGVPLARIAAEAGIPIRTARRWIARYRATVFGLIPSSRLSTTLAEV